jgi:hypothetical protein
MGLLLARRRSFRVVGSARPLLGAEVPGSRVSDPDYVGFPASSSLGLYRDHGVVIVRLTRPKGVSAWWCFHNKTTALGPLSTQVDLTPAQVRSVAPIRARLSSTHSQAPTHNIPSLSNTTSCVEDA